MKTHYGSRILIARRTVMFDAELAKRVGLIEAAILQQIHYWCDCPKSGVMHEGRKWIYNTQREWENHIGVRGISTIKTAIKNLKKRNLVFAKKLSPEKTDHTMYYCVNYDEVEKIEQEVDSMISDQSESDRSEIDQSDRPKIDQSTRAGDYRKTDSHTDSHTLYNLPNEKVQPEESFEENPFEENHNEKRKPQPAPKPTPTPRATTPRKDNPLTEEEKNELEQTMTLWKKVYELTDETRKPWDTSKDKRCKEELLSLVRKKKAEWWELRMVIYWARNDDFWRQNFRSPMKLSRPNKEGESYFEVFLAKVDYRTRSRFDPELAPKEVDGVPMIFPEPPDLDEEPPFSIAQEARIVPERP